MDYGRLFTKSWKSLGQSIFIWLFSAMIVFIGLILPHASDGNTLLECLRSLVGLATALLGIMATAGIIQTVYLLADQEKPSVSNIWPAIKTNFARIFVLNFTALILSIFLGILCLFASGVCVRLLTSRPISREIGLHLFPLLSAYIYTTLSTFFICGVLITNTGVRASVRYGLALTLNYLKTIFVLNLILIIGTTLTLLVFHIGLLLVQNGFVFDVIKTYNFQTYLSLTSVFWGQIIYRAAYFVILPFQFSLLTFAYLEFSS